jgi:hypothetical protein
MLNDNISFEQAVRFLSLDEVLALACARHSAVPVVERTLVSLPRGRQSVIPTVPARVTR